MVDAGEYIPEAEIGPVELVPPAKPSTDHATAELPAPLTSALYCAWPPSLTWDGPIMETGAGVCAQRPLQSASKARDMIVCRLWR
jgi:hypothetical protein